MARESKEILAFNRGVISPDGLARIDLERMAMSAERQRNWMPRVLGSMMIRPGLEFIGNTNGNNFARQMAFAFSVDDTATIELTNIRMRVRVNDVLISMPTVTATVLDSVFTALTNWTDRDEATAVSSNPFDAYYGTYLSLVGTGENAAKRSQDITITDAGVEHALKVVVEYGTLTLRVGSGNWVLNGNDDFIPEVTLGRGEHHLSFTPTGNCFIEISSISDDETAVQEVSMAAAGTMVLDTPPWTTADLPFLRLDQSADVIYVACKDVRQMKIERRGPRSWSVVTYTTEDGPFRVQNTGPVTITPSAISGTATLTASRPIFNTQHRDNHSLFRVASSGQTVTDSKSAAGPDVSTPVIRVVGTEAARTFGVIIEGTFTAVATLQFAFTNDGPWNDQGTTWSVPISTNYTDGQDGQIIYYRLTAKDTGYTSGTITMTLTYTGGSIQGILRVDQFTSNLVVSGEVISPFGAIDASADWWEGEWSDFRGYPTSVSLHEGRLWWSGNDKIWGSISDSYESFDDETEGDAGTISRSIGFGPIKIIHWMVSMGRLLFGTSTNSANVAAARLDGNDPLGARSNSFDEPLTPTNFNMKTVSTKSVFVDRSEQRLYELTYNIDEQDYKPLDLSVFAPDFNEAGIVQIAVQMKPDVRVHCVRRDGTAGILIFDRLENVICWVDVDSAGAGGLIEDVSVLPGTVEDQVYYIVKRTINGATQRHLCKWALESEAVGGQLNKMADSFVTYTGAATVTPFTTELLHLRGETVVIWADGIDVGTDTVTAAGALTNPLAISAANVVAGLTYTAQFKSAKLSELTGIGLLERKKVNRIGFIATNMHYQGLQYGPDFNNLEDLPQVSRGEVQSVNKIYSTYHEDNFPFGGVWDEDSRICLQAAAPRPCKILAVLAEIESVERQKPQRRRQ